MRPALAHLRLAHAVFSAKNFTTKVYVVEGRSHVLASVCFVISRFFRFASVDASLSS